MTYFGSNKHKIAVVKGGQKRAQQLLQIKEQAIRRYNISPSVCLQCKQALEYERRRNKFCSSSCAAKTNNKDRTLSEYSKQKISNSLKQPVTMETRSCPTCNIKFVCKSSNKKVYCTSKCYSISPCGKRNSSRGGRIGGKISASKQLRRSKNEILFANMCKSFFSDVLENFPMFDGWDADIIIPSQKLAILWNGNWHRKKLREGHSLKQVQVRDKIKLRKIIEYGYTPYVIDDYGKHNPLFVENEFQKFLSRQIEAQNDRNVWVRVPSLLFPLDSSIEL